MDWDELSRKCISGLTPGTYASIVAVVFVSVFFYWGFEGLKMAQAGVTEAKPAVPSNGRVCSPHTVVHSGWPGFCLEIIATLGTVGVLYNDVVPHIWNIVIAIYEELISAGFYRDLGITFAEHVVGFIVGSIIAIFVGIWMGTSPLVRGALEPYLNAIGAQDNFSTDPVPDVRNGIESKMAKGSLSAFFPVVFTTTLGMVLINPVLIRVGKTFNLNKWQMITKIYMPAMVNPGYHRASSGHGDHGYRGAGSGAEICRWRSRVQARHLLRTIPDRANVCDHTYYIRVGGGGECRDDKTAGPQPAHGADHDQGQESAATASGGLGVVGTN